MARLRIAVTLITLGILLSCMTGCGKKGGDSSGTSMTPPAGRTSAPAATSGTTAPDAATPADPGATGGEQYTPPPAAEGDPPLEEPAVPQSSAGNRPGVGSDTPPGEE